MLLAAFSKVSILLIVSNPGLQIAFLKNISPEMSLLEPKLQRFVLLALDVRTAWAIFWRIEIGSLRHLLEVIIK